MASLCKFPLFVFDFGFSIPFPTIPFPKIPTIPTLSLFCPLD